MTPATLAALVAFNAALVSYVAVLAPDARVFVGGQPGEGAAFAWTKCVEESHVYVIQVSEATLKLDVERIRFAAAHEACHLSLHRELLCGGKYQGLPAFRQREVEMEADRCASAHVAADREARTR